MISLTRRYHFPASHRLHSPLLAAAENARVYGKCNNPFGHGHDYTLEVTVSGTLEPTTGLLLPLARLDQFVADKILSLFAYRNINIDVPQFANLVPTTENVVVVICDLIREHWTAFFRDLQARVSRVQLQETDRNGFELFLPAAVPAHLRQNESVLVHV